MESGADPSFFRRDTAHPPRSDFSQGAQWAPWVQPLLPMLQSLKSWGDASGGPQGRDDALGLGAHAPLLLFSFNSNTAENWKQSEYCRMG